MYILHITYSIQYDIYVFMCLCMQRGKCGAIGLGMRRQSGVRGDKKNNKNKEGTVSVSHDNHRGIQRLQRYLLVQLCWPGWVLIRECAQEPRGRLLGSGVSHSLHMRWFNIDPTTHRVSIQNSFVLFLILLFGLMSFH